jgi:hypothetical protein
MPVSLAPISCARMGAGPRISGQGRAVGERQDAWQVLDAPRPGHRLSEELRRPLAAALTSTQAHTLAIAAARAAERRASATTSCRQSGCSLQTASRRTSWCCWRSWRASEGRGRSSSCRWSWSPVRTQRRARGGGRRRKVKDAPFENRSIYSIYRHMHRNRQAGVRAASS